MTTDNTIRTVEGIVKDDIYGSWDDCSPGRYVGTDSIESALGPYLGKYVRVTIQIVPRPEEQ